MLVSRRISSALNSSVRTNYNYRSAYAATTFEWVHKRADVAKTKLLSLEVVLADLMPAP